MIITQNTTYLPPTFGWSFCLRTEPRSGLGTRSAGIDHTTLPPPPTHTILIPIIWLPTYTPDSGWSSCLCLYRAQVRSRDTVSRYWPLHTPPPPPNTHTTPGIPIIRLPTYTPDSGWSSCLCLYRAQVRSRDTVSRYWPLHTPPPPQTHTTPIPIIWLPTYTPDSGWSSCRCLYRAQVRSRDTVSRYWPLQLKVIWVTVSVWDEREHSCVQLDVSHNITLANSALAACKSLKIWSTYIYFKFYIKMQLWNIDVQRGKKVNARQNFQCPTSWPKVKLRGMVTAFNFAFSM